MRESRRCATRRRCSNIRQSQREQPMTDVKKNARGAKRPRGAAAGKRADAPLLGEAALKAALAGFGSAPSKNGGAAAPSEAAPKTVAQVLGEIASLMAESPRHKSMAVGDLEWLVM